jgi:hypothetical protein
MAVPLARCNRCSRDNCRYSGKASSIMLLKRASIMRRIGGGLNRG